MAPGGVSAAIVRRCAQGADSRGVIPYVMCRRVAATSTYPRHVEMSGRTAPPDRPPVSWRADRRRGSEVDGLLAGETNNGTLLGCR